MEVVLKAQGSNEYDMPRSNWTHKNDGPTYIPQDIQGGSEGESGEDTEDDEGEEGEEECDGMEGYEVDDSSKQEGNFIEEESLSDIFIDIATQSELADYWLKRIQEGEEDEDVLD